MLVALGRKKQTGNDISGCQIHSPKTFFIQINCTCFYIVLASNKIMVHVKGMTGKNKKIQNVITRINQSYCGLLVSRSTSPVCVCLRHPSSMDSFTRYSLVEIHTTPTALSVPSYDC